MFCEEILLFFGIFVLFVEAIYNHKRHSIIKYDTRDTVICLCLQSALL